ncbi:MAG: ABC transporter ATP-binding protein [Planctomycetes bacterium]|nr:ABC transporter ATP-binding protein [Planctomycetota bacterium]
MIEIRNLRKEYDGTVAIENLNLEIPEGEVFGLIGPNGAGKTTLIRILSTLLEPTYGTARIAGIDVLEEPLRVHPLIGYMSDFFSLYDDLLVWEYLDHFGRCYGIRPLERERLIEDVLHLVSLDVRRDSEVKALSRGMRQRLCFAKTLLHQPKVLLLDEPASGLDPAGRLEFRELVKKLKEMGRTVLISSHILTEMTEFCTSIGIMEQGQLLAGGRVEDILAKLQAGLRLDLEVLDHLSRLLELLKNQPSVSDVALMDGRVTCRFTGGRERLPELHRSIVSAGIPIVSFAARTDNLEDIYMRVSGHRTS